MAFLLNWIRTKPPPRIPTDTVIPLNSHDDNTAYRAIALELTMRFDEVLDSEKVSGALWKLLERPGWRKLGARLRLNAKGKLEYHVPAQYTKERPPINYTHAEYDVPFSQHPNGARFPRPNGTSALQVFDNAQVADVHKLTGPKNNTSYLADWIYTDKAQLGLYIVSFPDATLVTITWSHTLLDAMGLSVLLKAWIAMLDGREDDIPEFWGYDFNPLSRLGEPYDEKSALADGSPPKEEFVLFDLMIRGWSFFIFVILYLWEQISHRHETSRIILMPASYFSNLKKQAYNDLETADPSLLTISTVDPKNPKPFLSDGDILAAWNARLVTTSNPTILASKPTRTFGIMLIFGMRDVLTKTSPQLIPKGSAYIGNCIGHIFSLFTQREILTLPLGHIAARVRKDLVTQGTRAQIEAAQRLVTENKGEQLMYGAGDMAFGSFTNWLKAELYNMDFSAAIIREADVPRGKKHVRGQPTYLHSYASASTGFSARGHSACIGKDHEGNYWLGTIFRKQFAAHFDKAIEGLQ